MIVLASSIYDLAYTERNVNIDVFDSIDFASLSETKSLTAERKEKRDSRAKRKVWQQSERKIVAAEPNEKCDSRAKGKA